MASITNLERLNKIIHLLSGQCLPKKKIMEQLRGENIIISYRTLERDLKMIKEDLGYDLLYTKNSGYQIEEEFGVEEAFLKQLDKLVSLSALECTFENIDKTPDNASFLHNVIQALCDKRVLRMDYQSFLESSLESYKVIPLLLKEYQHFWYLIGFVKKENDVKVFRLDKISNIKTGKPFLPGTISSENAHKVLSYQNRIGISTPIFETLELMKIELLVNDDVLDRISSIPIHPSQEITSNITDNFTKVYLTVIPNVDFVKIVTAELGGIKVIAPKVLVEYLEKMD
jgi:predicted DNA-binding transcriptional regulator YafY